MIKNISKFLLLLAVAALASCSQGGDEPTPAPGNESNDSGTSNVTMAISRWAADDMIAAGISKFTVYVYKVERGGSSLYAEREINVADGDFTLEFPLGETFNTFAVANAGSVTDKDAFETVTVNLNTDAVNECYLSAPVKFASDKSVSEVEIILRRMIGEINFLPAETAAELAAQSNFDRLDVTFNNVATSYLVNKQTVTAQNVTISTDASKNYAISFTTFDASSIEENASIVIDYFKGGNKVNTSATPLDCGLKYEASKRYTLKVPVTDPGFIAESWKAPARGANLLTVEVTDFNF